ncbi:MULTISPECIES: GNAT family N-acetyltransferase [unclassified Paenibacillus]|uniref:GNAT family N-acetyltransferase n=1 Tax=unclassified Paenibacillus TaxID=185978 RepID=UPI0009DE9EB6|nr:GNAT family N-acetyltransferase [Paenibacillus sp. FSL H7-0737]
MMTLMNMVRGTENDLPAKEMIKYWNHEPGTLKLVRASSNFIYTFQWNSKHYYLRFTHEEDNSAENIQAELDFMMYLLEQGYETVAPVRSMQGKWIETLLTGNGRYHGVVFEQAQGEYVPLEEMSELQFQHWGQTLARLHNLSETYAPSTPARKSWVDSLQFILSVLRRHPEEHKALKEYERIEAWLSELSFGVGHTGLIHFDFETDNIFYMKETSRYSSIDFDDSMYHWFAMDITSALRDLSKQNDDESKKNIDLFISGYRSVKRLDDEYIKLLPEFQRFSDLYGFARLLRSLENLDVSICPEWALQLKAKLDAICDRIRDGFHPHIALKTITENNWYACTQLEVSNEQKTVFPVPVVYWLAESAYCGMTPLALYADEELVGFSVYAVDPEDGSYWIMAFMIDQKYQNRGFGRTGMDALIRTIKAEHHCDKIVIGHRIENERASNLYTSLGFVEMSRDEVEVIRELIV